MHLQKPSTHDVPAFGAARLIQRASSVARHRPPRFRGSDAKEGTQMSKAIGRDNIYREITDKIIAELVLGLVPWVQPWSGSHQLCPLGLPLNGLTRRNYSGINILLLWSALEEKGFASPYWLTFKQCIAMGGNVRKGEHGTHVYFADKFVPQKEQQRANDEGTDPSAIHL